MKTIIFFNENRLENSEMNEENFKKSKAVRFFFPNTNTSSSS